MPTRPSACRDCLAVCQEWRSGCRSPAEPSWYYWLCAACLLTMVAGPRVWSYEGGMMLPILAWAVAGGLKEPWRTRLVFLAVPMGLLWLVSAYTVVSGVAIVVATATIMWLWRWRPLGPDPSLAAAS